MDAAGGGEQRGVARRRDAGQVFFGLLDLAFLVEIRGDDPLVQHQRMPGGVEDGAAVDDAERAVHAQPQAVVLPWALHRIPAVISGLIFCECTGALPLRVHYGVGFAVTTAL